MSRMGTLHMHMSADFFVPVILDIGKPHSPMGEFDQLDPYVARAGSAPALEDAGGHTIPFSNWQTMPFRTPLYEYMSHGYGLKGFSVFILQFCPYLSARYVPYPVGYLHQSMNFTTEMADGLHIFILDEQNVKAGLIVLQNLLSSRTLLSQEIWLIDITALNYINVAIEKMSSFPLDINDDIYFFKYDPTTFYSIIDIWEVYKIHPSLDLVVMEYGNWTESGGLSSTNVEKWNRRKDLQVI
jgi:hypothetical protein